MRRTASPPEPQTPTSRRRKPPANLADVLRCHWLFYVDEGVELALFMISACAFTVWLFAPGAFLAEHLPSPALRRLLMGLAMGATAVGIIHSPMGKRSGAHFNPAITLTYFFLGKIDLLDAVFYVAAQFAGGIAGVGVTALFFGSRLAAPSVRYAVTVPGVYGTTAAFFAELFMASLLMSVVLWSSNRKALAGYTSYFVGTLIVMYIFFLAPVSGFSINPARTVASAVFAHVWTALWIYFVAPLAGMFGAAAAYVRIFGPHHVKHARLRPAASDLQE